MERFHEAGIIVIPIVPSVALAKRMEKNRVQTLLLQEGMEAGGITVKLTTMTLVRQVATAVIYSCYCCRRKCGWWKCCGRLYARCRGCHRVGTRFCSYKRVKCPSKLQGENFKNKGYWHYDFSAPTLLVMLFVLLKISWLEIFWTGWKRCL